MPIFEYRCASCGRHFETLQSRADDPSPSCPHCGGGRAERQLSTFAVVGPRAETAKGPCGSPDCVCRTQ